MNVCVYHNADLDGYASGAIWKTAHENELIEMVGLNYGQDVPWELLAGNDVTLLDFCIQPCGKVMLSDENIPDCSRLRRHDC